MRHPRLALFALIFSAIGCSSTGVGNPDLTSDEEALVTDGTAGVQAGDVSTAIAGMPTLTLDTASKTPTPAGAALSAELATLAFLPAGCATKAHTVGSATITYTFAPVGGVACSGPAGLEEIAGSITATFTSATTDGTTTVVDVSVTTSGLTLRGAPVTHSSNTIITYGGGVRTTEWSGTFTGQNAKGEPISHDADYTWSYDASSKCLSIDGSSSTTITGAAGPRAHRTAISGYQRCGARAACPQPGGTVVVTRADASVTVIITLLGGTAYSVDVPARSVEVQRQDLVCSP